MPDFDANDDPLRLTGAGKDEPLEPALIRPRFVPRARELAYAQCYARHGRPARRVGVALVAQGRRVARNACDRPIALLGSPPRRRRRLWTSATGDPPDLKLTWSPCATSTCAWCSRRPRSCWSGACRSLGYLIGAGAWLLTRAGTAFVHARARRVGDPKVRAGLQVAGMMGRVWLVALAVILARYAGGKDDGIMAAALVLAAFTVYFVMSFVTREGPLQGARARREGRACHERPRRRSPGSRGRRRPAMNASEGGSRRKLSTKQTLLALGGVWLGGVIVLAAIYGIKGTRNKAFEPQNEFKLDNWVHLGIFSINKAVLYLVLAAIATCVSMIYIARRMQQRPNKVQAAVELLYRTDARQHHRQRDEREDGGQVVPVHRRAVPVHPVLQPRRLHPAADQHRARDQRVRPAYPVLLAVRGHRQPLDPARAGAGRVRLLHLRRRARQGPDRLPQRARPRRRQRRHGRRDLLSRGALEPDAHPLADDSSVRQHPRRAT